jgi:hypothetical protein
MPQRVHAVTALFAHRDVSRTDVLDQDLMQVVLLGERAHRGGVTQEDLRPVLAWATDGGQAAGGFTPLTCWLPPLPWAMASPCSPTTVTMPIRSALFIPRFASAWLVTGQTECRDRPSASWLPHSPVLECVRTTLENGCGLP